MRTQRPLPWNRQLSRQCWRLGLLAVAMLAGVAECAALWRVRWQGLQGRAGT